MEQVDQERYALLHLMTSILATRPLDGKRLIEATLREAEDWWAKNDDSEMQRAG